MMDESFSESARGAGHGWGWTLALVVAVPVVYLLTFPPIEILYGGSSSHSPKWFRVYAMPAILLYEYVPPLQEPLNAYHWWWRGRL